MDPCYRSYSSKKGSHVGPDQPITSNVRFGVSQAMVRCPSTNLEQILKHEEEKQQAQATIRKRKASPNGELILDLRESNPRFVRGGRFLRQADCENWPQNLYLSRCRLSDYRLGDLSSVPAHLSFDVSLGRLDWADGPA
jgi:hypothetical protein